MTWNQINTEKSIRSGKLVTNEPYILKIIDRLFFIVIISFLIAAPLTSIYYDRKMGESLGVAPYLAVIMIFVLILTIYLLNKVNNLNRIKGLTKNENIKIIKEFVKSRNYEIVLNHDDFMAIKIPWEQTSHDLGKIMTVIYDGKDILVNCISHGLHGLTSPFHIIPTEKRIKELKRTLEEKRTTTSVNEQIAADHLK